MRFAVYFTPPPQAPLTQAMARWLGRDAFTGEEIAPQPSGDVTADEIRTLTAEPRRYGFHATLKAPFRLAAGQSEEALFAAAEKFCAERAPFAGPRLALRRLDGFLALVPAEKSPELDRLAADAVAAFEPFRAPLAEAEIARRRPERLSPGERENLMRWGYPHVFADFRFHMTLTGRVSDAEAGRAGRAIGAAAGPLLDAPLAVEGIALFAEPAPGAPFTVRSYLRFGRPFAPSTAFGGPPPP